MVSEARMKALKLHVEQALKMSNGEMPMDLLVADKEEAVIVNDLLKGRKNSKPLSAKVSKHSI